MVQTEGVRNQLLSLFPSLVMDIVVIKTMGDQRLDVSVGVLGKGVFTKEIEEALLSGRVDLAVHSLKDLPTELPHGLSLGAVLEREDPRDCWVSRTKKPLKELPTGARVGTGSLRRQAQIRALRQDLRVDELRGNLGTRLGRVASGDYDAVVVAAAGVHRLGRGNEVTDYFDSNTMLSAPAQGCIGVEVRAGDSSTLSWVSALNHIPSERAARAERSFLSGLGGGCRVPIGALAKESGGKLTLDGLVISASGQTLYRGCLEGSPDSPEKIGLSLAENLLSQGASSLL